MEQSEASKPRKARIDLRMSVEQKELIEKAAEMMGLSLTGFLLSTCLPAAIAVIREYQNAVDPEQAERNDTQTQSPEPVADDTAANDEQGSAAPQDCLLDRILFPDAGG